MAKLLNTKASPLPAPPTDYSQLWAITLLNTLRLYFNTIDNFVSAIANIGGGSNLQFPNGAWHQDGNTTLAANITNVSTTPIQVASTAGFLSAGALMIGTELIAYTGKTSTTFTGITRGVYGSTKAAHSTGDYISEAQPVPSPTTALTIAFTTADVSNGINVNPTDSTQIVCQIAGYYNFQFSIQLLTYDSTIDNVTLWFRQNGVDVPYSAGVITVPSVHGGVAGATIASWNLVLPMNAGDYIQLLMSSTTGNTVAATYPSGTSPVRPVSPSIIMTATFVSALYT